MCLLPSRNKEINTKEAGRAALPKSHEEIQPPRPGEEAEDDARASFSGAICSVAAVLPLYFGHL